MDAALLADSLLRMSGAQSDAATFKPPARAKLGRASLGRIRKGSFAYGGYRRGIKKRSFKGRRAFRQGYSARKRYLRVKGARKTSYRKKPGTSRKAKVAVVAKGVTVDNFTERTVTTLASSSGNYDHQVIGLASPNSGLDILFFKNLYQTATHASPVALTASKIILYWHERTLTFHPGVNARMNLEVTRWRPRFDNDFTPTAAFADASVGDSNAADKSIIGATLFDCHNWCTSFKAVKTYKRTLWLGRSYKLRIKRKFPAGKLIDYDGQFFFTTTGTYPTDLLSTSNFYMKAGLSEVITYRVWGDSLVDATTSGHDAIAYPALYIEDLNKVGYSPALVAAKSALQSAYSAALHTDTVGPQMLDNMSGVVGLNVLV